jgi:hypothetical protein
MFKNPSVLHLTVNSTISSWSQGNLSFRLNDDLAVVKKGGDSALREKYDRAFMISEIFVCLEVLANFVVIHLTGHDIPFDHVLLIEYRIWEFLFG